MTDHLADIKPIIVQAYKDLRANPDDLRATFIIEGATYHLKTLCAHNPATNQYTNVYTMKEIAQILHSYLATAAKELGDGDTYPATYSTTVGTAAADDGGPETPDSTAT